MSKEVSRREFLVGSSTAAISLAILDCKDSTTVVEEKPPVLEEQEEEKPQMGDVVIVGRRNGYLLREEKVYPIPQLEKYIAWSKIGQYGRNVFPVSADFLSQYPRGEVPTMPDVLDLFTGNLKRNKPFGGEMNVFFAGFMSDDGEIFQTVRPVEGTFTSQRNQLQKGRWGIEDTFFFMYGERAVLTGIAEYRAIHTARDPRENMRHADEFMRTLKEQFPLCQFNIIGHSLGALFALEAARKHRDAVNNLILINGPVRGLEDTWWRKGAVRLLHDTLFRLKTGEEYVSDYLFSLWKNKTYQEELDDFTSSFVSSGRKLTVVIDKADPVVPIESAKLNGADEILISESGNPMLNRLLDCIPNPLNCAQDHGRPLRHLVVHEKIADRLGVDLADAA